MAKGAALGRPGGALDSAEIERLEEELVFELVRDVGLKALLFVVVDDRVPAVEYADRGGHLVGPLVGGAKARVIEGETEEEIRTGPVPVVLDGEDFDPDGGGAEPELQKDAAADRRLVRDVCLLEVLPELGAARIGAARARQRRFAA